jgi:hypothetical protein
VHFQGSLTEESRMGKGDVTSRHPVESVRGNGGLEGGHEELQKLRVLANQSAGPISACCAPPVQFRPVMTYCCYLEALESHMIVHSIIL